MQKTLIIVLLVAVVALAGVVVYQKLTPSATTPIVVNQPVVNQPVVNNAQQLQDETENWKTYTNDQYGFTIKYPNDWVLNFNSAVLEIKKTDTTQPKTQLTPGDAPLEYPYYGIKVYAFVEETNAKKLEDLGGTCVHDTVLDNKIVAGETAIKCTSGSAPGGYFDVIFMHNGIAYKLEYTYAFPGETKYKFASISDLMLSTFKFTK